MASTSLIDVGAETTHAYNPYMEASRRQTHEANVPQRSYSPILSLLFEHAFVQQSTQEYPENHLLGIPCELRNNILKLVTALASSEASYTFEKPTTTFDGLYLVCRQLWHEVRAHLAVRIAPATRVDHAIDHIIWSPASMDINFLALELPFAATPLFYSHASFAIRKLAHSLTDVRLYFTGDDSHGTRVYLHGCGNRDPTHFNGDHDLTTSSTSCKLLISGQEVAKRLHFINQIAFLKRLGSLVVSNFNIPLFQSHVLVQKPYLKRLSLITDPRATLHKNFTMESIGSLIKTPTEHFPPVEELEITANAALTSLAIIGKVAATLKHLTWVVPIASRQSPGGIDFDWCRDTTRVFAHLRHHCRVQSLRICFEGLVYDDYPNSSFINGVKEDLPKITSLEALELHVSSRSIWYGSEVIDSLPKNLKRLYISDTLSWPDSPIPRLEMKYLSRYNTTDTTDTEEIIGEDLERTDTIAMHTHRLGFVSYVYRKPIDPRKLLNHRLGVDAQGDLFMRLLKLNGRLLDRELNSHLRDQEPKAISWHVPTEDEGDEFKYDDHHDEFDIDPYRPKYLPEELCERVVDLTLDEGITDDDPYFDYRKEREAEFVFVSEKVAKVEDLPIRKYPVDVDMEEHDHWLSYLGQSI